MDGRAQNIPAVLRLLLGLVVLSTVAGLLMAGIAVPAIGATGQAAKGGVEYFNELPDEFEVSPLAQQSRILDADGNLIANPYDENRIIVPLKKISKHMRNAQIAIEDARFYEHGGLDLRGLTRAVVSNAQGGEIQGASTLTQQFVKVTLQEQALRQGDEEAAQAATAETYSRKLQELKYAVNVEEQFTKDQILEGYLNLVYYGDQAYGVEAAAINYFGTKASKLTVGQAAMLAGIVQQPTRFNPVLNPENAKARQAIVLDRMVDLDMITEERAQQAKDYPITKLIKKQPVKGVCHRSSEPYFCAYVMAYLQHSPQLAALGDTPEERLKRINQGGLTIRTTLDPRMQEISQAEIERAVPVGNRSNLGGATSVVEPGTGKVLAMAQASDFADNQTNVNVDQVYGGPRYGYQFGSTAKVFGMIQALEDGMPMNGEIYVPYASVQDAHSFDGDDVIGVPCGANEAWEVKNDYGIGGRQMSLSEGISKSINTWAAQLTIDVGPCKVLDLMTKMGVHQANGDEIGGGVSNATLGSGTTTPLSLATAYATIAAEGKRCDPSPIVSITTPDKEEIEVPKIECEQVISPDTANAAAELMEGTLRDGGTADGLWNVDERPAAGKTGTTEKHNQSWFAGFTPQLSTAVWIGNVQVTDDNQRLLSLNGKCFGDYGCFADVFGGTVSAPVWSATMKRLSEGMDVKNFPSPSEKARNGDLKAIPNVYARSLDSARQILEDAGFQMQTLATIDSDAPQGTVAGTSPRGEALDGSTVGVYVSDGSAPAPAPQPQNDGGGGDGGGGDRPGRGNGGGGGNGGGPDTPPPADD
ncbi:penicillin-binding protein [Phycicoccus sp. BSK3Z-2]|uniref:Penicillin-binding protein n=1 Tax=Phycicoccus avicenniae TaxID=2828860 RepID=A0A941D799_9MICO|nr:transglycosylase domain-containing protein [Phycicoccus avicenniae]MBR7743414.1 penicillin-binding protein [Phycicoccus avicenniae]